MKQLKTGDIANVRKQLCAKQKYLCPICGSSIAGGEVHLDHCHDTGQIRAALCKVCNRNEGKVKYAMRYMAIKGHAVWKNPIGWLRALADYLEYHDSNPSGLIHPTFDAATGKQKPKKRTIKRRTKK